jgi:hypothetical protein
MAGFVIEVQHGVFRPTLTIALKLGSLNEQLGQRRETVKPIAIKSTGGAICE